MPGDPDRFDDLFAPFGKIVVCRMFGGEGIYSDQVMIGLVFEERIYLKTSDETRPAFIAEGSSPFTYKLKKDGEHTSQYYYSLPDRLYDDPEELAEWARTAFAVARNKSAGKAKTGSGRKTKKKPSPPAKKKKSKKRR